MNADKRILFSLQVGLAKHMLTGTGDHVWRYLAGECRTQRSTIFRLVDIECIQPECKIKTCRIGTATWQIKIPGELRCREHMVMPESRRRPRAKHINAYLRLCRIKRKQFATLFRQRRIGRLQ